MGSPASSRVVRRLPFAVWPPVSRFILLAVVAFLVAGPVSGMSGPVDAQVPQSGPPPTPTGLTGTFTHESASLSWDDPGDPSITSYQILRRQVGVHDPGDFIVHLDDTNSSATSYVDSVVEAGTSYVYRIKARNSVGLSERSSFFNAVLPAAPEPTPTPGLPARPTGLTGLTGLTGTFTHESVALSWDDPADPSITSYQVLRRQPGIHEPGEFIVHLDDTNSSATSYVDSVVEAGTSYVYRVKARNSVGLSEGSSFFDADIPAAPDPTPALPGPPTDLTAVAAGETLIVLSWTAPEGADGGSILGYRIEVSADGETNWGDLTANTESTATAHAHTDLAPGATWHYRVSAINSAGTGAPSNVASATTDDRTPPHLASGAVGASGDTLELLFNEPLDLGAGRLPTAGAFTVAADGVSIAVGGVQMIPRYPQSVFLTGLVPAIRQGQAVSVSYTDPTGGNDEAAIQDRAGNDAASFSGQYLGNDSTAVGSTVRGSTAERSASLSPRAAQQIGELLAAKARRTAAQRKVSSQLLGEAGGAQPLDDEEPVQQPPGANSARDAGGGGNQPQVPSRPAGQQLEPTYTVDRSEMVTVDIRAEVTPAVLARIRALGGTVISSVPQYRAIRAVLPLVTVESLASLDAVESIRPADEAVTRKTNSSEGDTAHLGTRARTAHSVTGAGIGIGVISDGVATLAARQASGDLPAQVIVLPGQEGSGDEGTAILEIVHDLAPGADLYFATGFGGQAQFAANIEALCDAGANVIVDDIGYYLEANLQDDIIVQGVNAAAADGCYFFSAAGNDGNLNDTTSGVWEGDYALGSSLTVDGSTVGVRHKFGSSEEENPVLGSFSGTVVLQWADPLGASANDYDLFVVDDDGNVLASSTNTQDGTQDPFESISTGFFFYSDARLVVVKVSGEDRYLRLQAFGNRLGIATAGNTWGHAAAENAVGVGAVDVRTAGRVDGIFDGTESVRTSSSDGPRRVFFEPDGTPITAGNFSSTGGKVLQRPDLAAASCVSTATPGFSTFCGTSAAAPHAAAIAALMLEAAGGPKEVTLAELRTAMTATTAVVDIEADGTDRDSGAGIVMAPGAVDGLAVAAASRNRAPTVTTTLVDRTLAPGSDAVTVDLASTFTDAATDTLTYTVVSSDPDRLTATLSGTQLTLTPGSPGRSVVRVRATDLKGLAATASFTVTVTAGSRDYDADNDGLIEVSNLAQLDAMRYDLNGDGIVDGATWRPYYAAGAFAMGALEMGCPDGCTGYELSTDLDFDTDGSGATSVAGDTYWNDGDGWSPIGSEDEPFSADFEGGRHTLSNLFINRSTEDGIGLFGGVHYEGSGSIRGVGLANVNVTGKDAVGSLVGHSTYLTVVGSHATGRVAGGDGVGGLVGESSGNVIDSYAAVRVFGDEAVGGLVGHHILNRITTSYATGHVSGTNAVGGLVGATSDFQQLIEASYATGPVSGVGARLSSSDSGFIVCGWVGTTSARTSSGGGVGGLAGHSCGTIEASYATGAVSGTTAAGGLVGSGRTARFQRSYWDVQTSGMRVGVGEDDANDNGAVDGVEARRVRTLGLSTRELQTPTDYTGLFRRWNLDLGGNFGDGVLDDPWDFGTATQYPVLSVDVSGDNRRTWQEFGYQFWAAIPLTATTVGSQAQITLSWTAPAVSQWSPAPTLTYTLYRDDGTGASVLVSALSATAHTDTTVTAGTRYTYQVAAVIGGGEVVLSAPVAVTAGATNQPPLAATALADQTLLVDGSAVAVDVASAFREPDGDTLTYIPSSSQTSVATVNASGSQVTVTPIAAGRSVITVTATDASGSNSSVTQRFTVTVGKDYDSDGDGLIEIGTLAQLDAIRHDLNGVGVPGDPVAYAVAFPDPVDYLGCPFTGCSGYELVADLDFDTNGSRIADAGDTYWNDGAGWLPLGASGFLTFGSFRAVFDGNDHTIANLFISRKSTSYVGLFGALAGLIYDVDLTNVSVLGNDAVGGLLGINYGWVSGSRTTGTVKGDDAVGGLVGDNYSGAVTRSSSFATVAFEGNFDDPDVSFVFPGVGGLVGANGGPITFSYATGRVSGYPSGGLVGWNGGGTISASYATGAVAGAAVGGGGLVGRNDRGSGIYASHAAGRVSGSDDVGGLVGTNAGVITASYSTGPASTSAKTSSFDRNVGGLVGEDERSGYNEINASYWDSTTSGIAGGQSTAALQGPRGYSGIYRTWNLDLNGESGADDPWDFGTASQYPALSADFDGDGETTWQEFGHQLRIGPSVTTEAGREQVIVTWAAVDAGSWSPRPDVTYTVYRDGVAEAEDIDALDYADSGLSAATYTYQVAAVVDGGEATRSAPVTVTVSASATNTAPTASVSATPAIVDAGGTVTLDGTATDAESDTLTYRWTSSGGGTFADANALDTTWTAPARTNVAQHIVLTLTVTDDGAGTLADTVTVRVTVRPNQGPTASITTTPATVNGRGAVTLTATANDPEMDVLTYKWTSSGGGAFTDASALSTTWTAPAATGETQDITLTLRVTDAGDAFTTDTLRVEVQANQAPQVSVTPVNTTVSGGGSVTLDGTATDPEGDTLRYAWASNGGGRFANAAALDTTWTAPVKTNAIQSIVLTLTVTDNGAGRLVDTATLSVAVRANEPPTAAITSAPATVNGRGAFMLTATASDPDLDVLTYEWTSSGGGSFDNDKALNTTWTAPAATGTSQNVTLTLTVSDATSASTSDTVQMEVQANQAPQVLASPGSITVNGGGSVSLDGDATDPELDVLTYKWTSDGGGTFENDRALDKPWTAPAKTNAEQGITLTLTVTDNGAGMLAGTATVGVTVRANQAPDASVMPTSATVHGGARVTLVGRASDRDGDTLTYKWTSDGGGTFENDRALDKPWTAPAAMSTEQSITLTLTVTDGTMASDTATVQITVRANQPPEVSVAPESATVGGGSSLMLVGRATDPEGTRMTYGWTSSGGGDFQDALALSTTWTAPAGTTTAQSITLTLTVIDAEGVSATATVDVTVPERDNTAPRVSATTSVSTVDGGGTVTLRGRASDPQGDRLTYEWTSDGGGDFKSDEALVTEWIAPAAGVSDRGITLTLTVTDIDNASATATVSVTVRENQAPNASARANPATVNGGGAVMLRGEATDPEGEGLTYAWSSNGGGSFDNASALDTTWTAPPKTSALQNIVLTLTVTDAGAGARTGTANVDVTVRANEEPSASATANPTTVNGGGTVRLTGMARDGDDGTLTYRWSSDRGGAFDDDKALVTTWTAPRAATADETLVLTLTVTDSVNASASATASVTVRANQAPRVTVTPATTTVEGDGELAVSGAATDPEGDRLTYRWSSNGGGTFDDDAASETTWTAPPKTDTAQSITLTLTVTDDGVGSLRGAATVNVTVRGDQPPPPPPIIIGGGGGGGGPSPSVVDFEWTVTRDIEDLGGGHDKPSGTWSDGATLWVLENGDGADDAIYAYDLKTGERVEDREFELDETNRAPRSVWSDRTVLWVSDSGQEKLFAHDLETGDRLLERDIALADRNRDARGIWSDTLTMWVLDGGKESLFAYDLASGELAAEYALDPANDDPRGLFFDGVTFWVSDHGEKRIFAYRLEAGEDGEDGLERNRDEEFPNTVLSRAGNNSPRGLWSDGDVMYVADESDARVYTYNMPDALDARLSSLTLSGVDIEEFDRNRTDYEAVVADGVTETTVDAAAMQRRADVAIDPPDIDEAAEGYQVALEDLGEITVTVTSADGSRERVYRVRLGGDEAAEPAPDEVADPAPEEAAGPAPDCFRGDVVEGFSLLIYEGGSLEDLVVCAVSRHIVALYMLDNGIYMSYIVGAPDFVNRSFQELYPDGVPSVTPLIAGSDGPPSADPFAAGVAEDERVTLRGSSCLHGEITTGFSLVVFGDGSVEELAACAQRHAVTAIYALAEGEWLSYILGAPDFVNRPFFELFTGGLPAVTPLVARSEEPSSADSDGDGAATN